ncbi:MAG: hypothetical protein U0270_12785 [Labilithrix sp.]
MKLLTALVLTPTFLAFACSEESTKTEDPPAEQAPARDYEVTLSSDKLPVLQGTTATIDITVTRRAGFTAPITIAPSGLPSGASAAPITIAGDKATLTVSAEASAPHSLPTAVAIDDKKLTVTIYGRPGMLDTSFGAGAAPGSVVLPVGAGDDYGYTMAVQADGKILVAGRAAENLGDFAVVRLDRDGKLDPTFGQGGKVMTDIAGGADTAYAIGVQADGKIVVAGTALNGASGQDFALVRYEANGELDASFGAGGKVTTAFSSDADTAYALLLEADGSIVVGGDANSGASTTGLDFALARYAPDGKLQWKTTSPISSGSGRDSIYSLAKQEIDGKSFLVAAGGEGDFAVARYDLEGKLDPSFAKQGKIAPPFESAIGAARAVAIDANGNIVVAGHRGHDFALVRLDRTGDLDQSFGDHGKVITEVSKDNWDEAQAVAIESDGKIVAGGWTYEGGSSSANFTLVRYDPSGKLDPVFGGTGIVISEIATTGKPDTANAIVLQSDERVPTTRVLAAGFASTSNSEFAIARYWR